MVAIVGEHRDPGAAAGVRRGLAVPCFADDPADLADLGTGAERAGLDGYFLWDHIAVVRDRIAALRGGTTDFDVAVWGELDAAGQVAALLPGYRAAGATWWLESPGSGPGWLDAVRDRLGRGTEVQSPRG